MRQRLKNAYIELRWGFMYNNFPWELKSEYQTYLIYLRNNLNHALVIMLMAQFFHRIFLISPRAVRWFCHSWNDIRKIYKLSYKQPAGRSST